MGDFNAVYIAQHTNMGILDKHQALPHKHLLTGRGVFPRGPVAKAMAANLELQYEEDFCLGVYIDDVGCLAVVPWSKLNKPNASSHIISKVDVAYEKEHIPQSLEKILLIRVVVVFGAGILTGPPAPSRLHLRSVHT